MKGKFLPGPFLITVLILSLGMSLASPSVVLAGTPSTWIQQSPIGTLPEGRSLPGVSAYDEINDRLIVFSGRTIAQYQPTDVWVLINASGVNGTPSWIQLSPSGGPPPGRWAGTVVYDPTSNRLIVHGGCAGMCSPALDDVWMLTNANGLGGTPAWMQLPDAPVSRAYHTAVYDSDSNRMIVFGGNQAFFGTFRNDVWVLKDANGIGNPAWEQLTPAGTLPGVRASANAVYDQASNRMIVFGGDYSPSYGTRFYFNDVWVLTGANGQEGIPQWIYLDPTGAPPAARNYSSAVYDPSTNRMIIFGGSVDEAGEFNDTWLLTNANGVGGVSGWIQLDTTGTSPAARYSHAIGYSISSQRMIVVMGSAQQPTAQAFSDVWVLTNATGDTNSAPSLQLSDATIDEGSALIQNSSFLDPDDDTWTATVDYGDGAGIQPLTLVGKTFDLSHAYADDGVYTVEVCVTDDDGGSSCDALTVTVNNVVPVVMVSSGETTIVQGQTFTGTGSFADPGADTWTALVDYGDGSNPQPLTLVGNTFDLSHTYVTAGTFTMFVTVTDDDGGIGSGALAVTVQTPQEAIEDITGEVQTLVDAGNLTQGQGDALVAKLEAAIRSVDQGHTTPAIQQIKAFINQINDFIASGALTPSVGQMLIDAANAAIASLGG